jgi:chemotaxis signal transduction protein
MMNLRGNLIPVKDLKQQFTNIETILTRKSRIMVVESQGTQIGLLVDQVTQVLKINEQVVENTSRHEDHLDETYIKGICHLDERLIILLHIDRIIENEHYLN